MVPDSDVAASYEKENDDPLHDKVTQTDCLAEHIGETAVSSQTQTDGHLACFSVQNFVHDDEGMQFYTGLENYCTFLSVLASLGPSAFHLNYLYDRTPDINIHDRLFLTLVKCQTYKQNFELSRLFGISERDVYVIFVTWIRFMSI